MYTDKFEADGRRQRTPEYYAWARMKHRCNNANNKRYHRYGSRGISVCDRWMNSYEAFLEDMGRRPSSKHSIDRIDNDDNYYKENCRWATRTQQGRNTSTSTTKSWILAEELGINVQNAINHISRIRCKDKGNTKFFSMSAEREAHVRDFMGRVGCK